MFYVRMLGVLTISVDGKRITEDLGPTGRTLFGYLFEFMGRVHRRERLADQFWGHLDPDRARAALNTALWRLRKLLARDPESGSGRNLRTNGSEIVLDSAPWLVIDTHCFDAAVKGLLTPGSAQDAATRLHTLESITESYVGPFLDGEDADWILEERERLHSLYVRAASELVRSYGCAERYDEAIVAARRIVTADPFRESIFRKLAVLLVLNGQRADALRLYERWRAAFLRELGIDPMPQTLRLAEEIRSGEIFDHLDAVKQQYFCAASEKSREETLEEAARPPESSVTRLSPRLEARRL